MQCPVCRTPIGVSTPLCPYCGAALTPAVSEASPSAADPLRAALDDALGAQYEIIRLLGRGAMGAVYLARERSLERLVAIKVLPSSVPSHDARERFRREVRIAAKLAHPNILPLYTFGEVGGLAYYVMGYVRGESLRERLTEQGPLPSDEARRIIAQLADALDYAHRQGVVHRDIKPDNVLIEDESGRPMLCDFGIAKGRDPTTSPTETGVAVGTPYYMSPEQAMGERAVDGRSDIYSLGVLAFQLLTGRVPFDAPNAREVLVQHVTNEPPSLHALAPSVPDDLASAVLRCLAKNPEARWPDGKSLKEALGQGGFEDDALPQDIADVLPGLGMFAALWALVWGGAALYEYRTGRDPVLLALIALLVPFSFLFAVWSTARKGFRTRLILRVGFWPPKWWGMWWPRAWRRPGDVWFHLPRPIRLARLWLTCLLAGVPILTYAVRLAGAGTAAPRGAAGRPLWLGLTLYGLVAGTAVAVGYATWWARRHGISWEDMGRLLFGAPVGSMFWGRPDIARLLAASPSRGTRPTQPQTTHEYLNAISEAAQVLTGSARAIGTEAVAAARQILGCIDALDVEIKTLTSSADAADLAHLEQKIAALGEPNPAESDDQRQMRDLLTSQLALMHRLSARLKDATARRAQLADMLRLLWLQLVELRSQKEPDAARSLETSARLRTLCGDAEHLTRATLAASRT